MRRSIKVFASRPQRTTTTERPMKTLALLLLAFVSSTAFAQTNVRVRGTITALNGDVLMVKSRDGRDIQLHLTPDAQVVTAKKTTLAEMGPNAYVGVTSVKGPDGRMVAKEVHAIGPQVPQMHGPWDSTPNSMMTNANITSVAQAGGGNEITLKYKDGEQKIVVTPQTEVVTFVPGTLADIKPGDFLGVTSTKSADGALTAYEVRRFPKPLNPGHRPFDGRDDQTMTNATVGAMVQAANGRELTLTYDGSSQKIVVPQSASVSA